MKLTAILDWSPAQRSRGPCHGGSEARKAQPHKRSARRLRKQLLQHKFMFAGSYEFDSNVSGSIARKEGSRPCAGAAAQSLVPGTRWKLSRLVEPKIGASLAAGGYYFRQLLAWLARFLAAI